jgi:ABC-type multidrug transport system ATPase subunit
MSGGEQQMLAMGRALMARPKVLLLDEPSMGLSPIMVDKIFEVVADIHGRGTTMLLVEQNASRALALANRGYVMDSGEVTMSGEAKALLADPKGEGGLPGRVTLATASSTTPHWQRRPCATPVPQGWRCSTWTTTTATARRRSSGRARTC